MIESTPKTIICEKCSNEFQISQTEYEHKTKNNKRLFCSNSCRSSFFNKLNNNIRFLHDKGFRGGNHLGKGELNIYKRYLHNVKRRADRRNIEYKLDKDFLDSIWTGKCALTGSNIHFDDDEKDPASASLDRIDCSKGYVPGNVQWASYSANMAKNNFSDDMIKQWFGSLKNVSP